MPTLNWIGKDEILRYNPPYHTLEKKYTFNAKNSDNMIIKGDNLLALKALLLISLFISLCLGDF
ncbi:hypothetical protein [Campylobacter devanensis]|uniref:hypothetical protein n=1 Tax=Campylobacter devanensis TaxID=3161138 RepID=UPI000A33C4E2|nr:MULTISPECIES: hypothetical protein [unclassified Campylobacter]